MKPINSLAIDSLAIDKNAVSSAALPKTPNVFLVDDDPSVRRALTRLIKSAGHQVQTFASAQEFLQTGVAAQEAACLVLDVRMPGLTGIELQRQLQILNRNVPIVFMTGHGNIPMSVQAMKAGAVDFLPKPVKDTDLLRAIEQALARAVRDRAERNELEDVRELVGKIDSARARSDGSRCQGLVEQTNRFRTRHGGKNHQSSSREGDGKNAGGFARRPSAPRREDWDKR